MSKLNIPRQTRYRRRVGAFGGVNKRLHKSVIGFSAAAECYNFDTSSGALKAGYGTAAHDAVPDNAVRYYMYRYYSATRECFIDQYVYQISNGRLMFYEPKYGNRYYISGEMFPPMQALNYRLNSEDVLLLSFEGKKLMIWNGDVLTECQSPTISSMALHYERLFVTSAEQPTRVFFSENLDPTSFQISSDGGGFIELLDERGELNKVVSFGNYLYIFRDHGISRVTAYGDQREFSVVNLFVTAGRIYPSSIATCGNTVMFLASDGLYAFDGYDCQRLSAFDGLIRPDGDCACAFFAGKYYLSCKMRFDADAELGLLVYDVNTDEFDVSRGPKISFMNAVTYNDEDMLVCCDDGAGGVIVKNGMRFGVPLEKLWRGPDSDYGTADKTKTVREICISTTVPVSITLASEKKQKTVAVKPGERAVRVNFNAKRFSLSVSASAAECEISPPTVVYGVN